MHKDQNAVSQCRPHLFYSVMFYSGDPCIIPWEEKLFSLWKLLLLHLCWHFTGCLLFSKFATSRDSLNCHQPNTKEYEGNSLCYMVTHAARAVPGHWTVTIVTNRIKWKWRPLFYNTNDLYQHLYRKIVKASEKVCLNRKVWSMGIREILDAILYPCWYIMGRDQNIQQVHTIGGLNQK